MSINSSGVAPLSELPQFQHEINGNIQFAIEVIDALAIYLVFHNKETHEPDSWLNFYQQVTLYWNEIINNSNEYASLQNATLEHATSPNTEEPEFSQYFKKVKRLCKKHSDLVQEALDHASENFSDEKLANYLSNDQNTLKKFLMTWLELASTDIHLITEDGEHEMQNPDLAAFEILFSNNTPLLKGFFKSLSDHNEHLMSITESIGPLLFSTEVQTEDNIPVSMHTPAPSL